MRKISLLLALILCLGSCGKTPPEMPETEIPETVLQEEPPQTAPPEEQPPSAFSGEEESPDGIISAGQDDGIDNPVQKVDVPEPSFTPVSLLITELGDMQLDPEGYYYFVEDETIEIEYSCEITMEFPDSWELTSTTAQDIPRAEAGIYSTKRMEFYPFLYRTPESDEEGADAADSTTPSGQSYRYWEENGSSIDRLGVIWYHCEYPVNLGADMFWFHIYFLAFSNDPAGYFEEHIQPVIDSVTISVNQ